MRGPDVSSPGSAVPRRARSQALADGNAAYEAKFGQVYLVSRRGAKCRGAARPAAAATRNDPETERAVVRRELGKINRLRLADW